MVQEAYLRAYRGLEALPRRRAVPTWLYRITANCAATHLGQAARAPPRRAARRRRPRRQRPRARPRRPGPTPPYLRERLDGRPRRPAAQAPRRRGAARRLRPAPRGDRRRARASPRSAAKVRLHRARRKLREQAVPRPSDADDEEDRCPCGVTISPICSPVGADGVARAIDRQRPPPRRAVPALPGRARRSTASCCGPCTTSAPRCSSPRRPPARDPRPPRGGRRAPRRALHADRPAPGLRRRHRRRHRRRCRRRHPLQPRQEAHRVISGSRRPGGPPAPPSSSRRRTQRPSSASEATLTRKRSSRPRSERSVGGGGPPGRRRRQKNVVGVAASGAKVADGSRCRRSGAPAGAGWAAPGCGRGRRGRCRPRLSSSRTRRCRSGGWRRCGPRWRRAPRRAAGTRRRTARVG